MRLYKNYLQNPYSNKESVQSNSINHSLTAIRTNILQNLITTTYDSLRFVSAEFRQIHLQNQ